MSHTLPQIVNPRLVFVKEWTEHYNIDLNGIHLLKVTNIRMALVPAAHVARVATDCQSWLPLQKLCNHWTAATTLNHILPDAKPP